jgi:hypothetical protein
VQTGAARICGHLAEINDKVPHRAETKKRRDESESTKMEQRQRDVQVILVYVPLSTVAIRNVWIGINHSDADKVTARLQSWRLPWISDNLGV